MFLARTVTLYVVLGVNPVMVCLYTPGLTVLTSTLLMQTCEHRFEIFDSFVKIQENRKAYG